MDWRTVDTLGLKELERIKAFKDFIGTRGLIIMVVVSDHHVGSRWALFPSRLVLLDGETVVCGSKVQVELYETWFKFIDIVNAWQPHYVCHLGDIINASGNKKRAFGDDIINIENQKYLAEQILEPLCKGRKAFFISGTPYHDALDTKVHIDIARRLGATFSESGYLYFMLNGVGIFMSHKGRHQALYSYGQLERESIFTDAAVKKEDLPQISLDVSGHFHRFSEVPGKIEVGGWTAYFPIKGDTSFKGIRQPDIGGLVILIKPNRDPIVLQYKFPIQSIKEVRDLARSE